MFGVCGAWFSSNQAEAQKPAPAAKKSNWVRAVIYVDGAAVYKAPSFDSEVQDYLRYQTKVIVSREPYHGEGGMGLFHLVRYGKKRGYVPDTDVRVARKEAAKVTVEAKKSKSKAWEKEEEENLGKAPIYFTRYLGAAVSMVNFSEKFQGKRFSDNMMMYGLRMTGPGTLIEDGPPLDFNLWFSIDKPGYYSKKLGSSAPTGFMMFGDVMAMLPLIDMKNTIINYGLGVMWVYTNYKVQLKSRKFDTSEFRVGLDAGLGVGQKIGKYMLRLDGKYYYEKTQYFGVILSFQGEY